MSARLPLLLATLLLVPVAGPALPVAAQSPTAAASSAAATPAVTIADFAAIAAGEPRVELDPSGTAATLTVSTTIPAACSVVFGADANFGAHRDGHGHGGRRAHRPSPSPRLR